MYAAGCCFCQREGAEQVGRVGAPQGLRFSAADPIRQTLSGESPNLDFADGVCKKSGSGWRAVAGRVGRTGRVAEDIRRELAIESLGSIRAQTVMLSVGHASRTYLSRQKSFWQQEECPTCTTLSHWDRFSRS